VWAEDNTTPARSKQEVEVSTPSLPATILLFYNSEVFLLRQSGGSVPRAPIALSAKPAEQVLRVHGLGQDFEFVAFTARFFQ